MRERHEPSHADPFSTFLAEISRFRVLSDDETRELARKYRAGDLRAGHHLVASNLRFVVKVARENARYGLSLADLVQEGSLGLMKAVQNFDPDRGVHLISYAVWWIRAYIQRFILANWSLVKLGTTVVQRKLFFALARAHRTLERKHPNEPATPEEIAAFMRVSPAVVEEMEARMPGDVFADAPVRDGSTGDEASTALADLLPDTRPTPEDETANREFCDLLRRRVASALDQLDARSRRIVEEHVMSEHPGTLRQIGDSLGVSRERVRQIELSALRRLRPSLEAAAAEAG